MSQVTLTVGNRKYTVACAPGEEDRVSSLGVEIDSKLDQLGGNLAPQEAQNLLFAALLLADEMRETKLSLESERETAAKHRADSDESVAAAARDVSVAQTQRDELTSSVAALEAELDGLKSAKQEENSEVTDLRGQVQERTEEAREQRELAEKSITSAGIFERERDELKPALELAEKARAAGEKARETAETDLFEARKEAASSASQIADLKEAAENLDAELAAAKEAAANQPAGALADDPNLAPALERFAEMLENCAVKLEASTASA